LGRRLVPCRNSTKVSTNVVPPKKSIWYQSAATSYTVDAGRAVAMAGREAMAINAATAGTHTQAAPRPRGSRRVERRNNATKNDPSAAFVTSVVMVHAVVARIGECYTTIIEDATHHATAAKNS
jgi:hypothetical protein